MPRPLLIRTWTVRASTPGPDLRPSAVVIYPDEFRPIAAHPDQPGLRVGRRGVLLIAAAQVADWRQLLANVERGAHLILREPSGRNHEITPGWTFVPADQHEQYGPDDLAGLITVEPGDAVVRWRAADSATLAEFSEISGGR